MKLRLVELLRCPSCKGSLALRAKRLDQVARQRTAPQPRCAGLCAAPDGGDRSGPCAACGRLEIIEGTLECGPCRLTYPVTESIPRMTQPSTAPEAETARTAVTFGHLWSLSTAEAEPSQSYHFEKMVQALSLDPPRGLVMDAGCGDGIDFSRHAARDGVEVVGVELSDGGCRTSEARVRRFANAHVVQADLRGVPFATATFDRVYSYGVLHHVASPPTAAVELARVLRPGGTMAIYLYEDFGERALAWRIALALVNSTRAITTRLPPRLLYALCQIGSPVVFLTCVVPYHLLRRVPGLKALAAGIPFRHGKGPFRLTGDLYDRFSAPIEYRYSRRSAAELLVKAGLRVQDVAYERGWMVSARRDAAGTAAG